MSWRTIFMGLGVLALAAVLMVVGMFRMGAQASVVGALIVIAGVMWE